MNEQRPLKVVQLGCGVVGTQVARLLQEQSSDLEQRVGARLELTGIAVRDLAKERSGIDRSLLTADAEKLVEDADIVVELMGGIEPARSLILRAIESGASVVTANKALLAQDGPTLYAGADRANVDLYYEAAVAGAIPIVRPMRESLAGDRVTRVLGIVNGTTNYVLDRMTREGLDQDDVVRQAQILGYAEEDPTADVEGYDAAAKAAILASLAFHTRVGLDEVHREGITGITAEDVAAAASTGHVIKLLAVVERVYGPDGAERGVIGRVHPALIPLNHPLGAVHGAFNAVFVEADAAGEIMFYGPGAGGAPTASAVLGDIVSVARHRVNGGRGPRESYYTGLSALPIDSARTRYQVRLKVADRPGVLEQVAGVFAAGGVSISAVRQEPMGNGDPDGQANLLVVTHEASDAALRRTVDEVALLDIVSSVAGTIRVEGA